MGRMLIVRPILLLCYNSGMKNINIKDDSGKLFYIGGVVRDELLGRASFDVDIVFEGEAIEHCSDFGEVVRVNPDFGTVRVKVDGVEVDFASTRTESYSRVGHLPVVEKIGCSLKEDVLRRDFTVNALAKSLKTGEIVDFTGGMDDLKAGVLRVLHDRSFIEDPTRIIRALKFSVRFGFKLDDKTRKLQEEYLENVNYDMCYKRIKKELIETFNLNSQEAFERFYDEGIYKLVTSEAVVRPEINLSLLISTFGLDFSPNLWLVYAGLMDLSRLELTKNEARILKDFYVLRESQPVSDLEIYKSFAAVQPETLALFAAYVDFSKVLHYIQNLQKVSLEINGDDLVALGIKPSPKYAEIFDAVLEAKLQNPLMTKDDELDVCRRYCF